jgi:hypothetical protein
MNAVTGMGWREQIADRYRLFFYIVLLAAGTILLWFLPDKAALRGACLGACVGLLVHFRITWIFRVELPGETYGDVEMMLRKLGYLQETQELWIPRVHRMLRFDSQNITVKASGLRLVLVGPAYILRRVSRLSI